MLSLHPSLLANVGFRFSDTVPSSGTDQSRDQDVVLLVVGQFPGEEFLGEIEATEAWKEGC